MKLTIGHLYPELLNLYGDRGNIICMVQRLKWRGIDAEVREFDLNDKIEQPIRHSRENFGLKNLNQRLKLFYGPDYGLHIEKNDSGGITVTIKIRKMTVEEYEESHVPLMEGEVNPLV